MLEIVENCWDLLEIVGNYSSCGIPEPERTLPVSYAFWVCLPWTVNSEERAAIMGRLCLNTVTNYCWNVECTMIVGNCWKLLVIVGNAGFQQS